LLRFMDLGLFSREILEKLPLQHGHPSRLFPIDLEREYFRARSYLLLNLLIKPGKEFSRLTPEHDFVRQRGFKAWYACEPFVAADRSSTSGAQQKSDLIL